MTARAVSTLRGCCHPDGIRRRCRLLGPLLLAILRRPSLALAKWQRLRVAYQTGGLTGVVQTVRRAVLGLDNAGGAGSQDILDGMRALASRTSPPAAPLPAVAVTVVIPVYRDAAATRRCLESVLAGGSTTPHRILAINDASPDPDMAAMLATLASAHPRLTVLDNARNLGFVRTVNRGFDAANPDDVIVLNSDTVAAGDWLDRLVRQAYAASDVGTVTPFSNNATICSYPDLAGWPDLPPGETVASLDSACALAAPGFSVDIPTAHGFCMYIRRDCLTAVGGFDADSFGQGYGEENDFCLRAAATGWRHRLACDVFVFHQGTVSFGASANVRKQAAARIIDRRYPHYAALIAAHVERNQARLPQLAVTAARYRLGSRPVLLFLCHALDGGTEKHVRELADRLAPDLARVLFLRPNREVPGGDLLLTAHDPWDRLQVPLSSRDLPLLAQTLRLFGPDKVHVHHTLGFPLAVDALLAALGLPYDVTIHDFYAMCPRIHLHRPPKGPCLRPSVADCNACLDMDKGGSGPREILWWRARQGSLLGGARLVHAPSRFAARLIGEHYPAARLQVLPHEEPFGQGQAPAPTDGGLLRIALLGAISDLKGLGILEGMLATARRRRLPVRFVLLGYATRPVAGKGLLEQTGPYADADLPALIEQHAPSVILFPSQCPETYSYTLSAAIRSGRPLAVADIGALPERVAGLENVLVYPVGLSGEAVLDRLLEAWPPSPPRGQRPAPTAPRVNPYYAGPDYLPVREHRPQTSGTDRSRTVLLVCASLDVPPSPSFYRRLLLPLLHGAGHGEFSLRLATPEGASHLRADLVLLGSSSCAAPEALSPLLVNLARTKTKVICDADDDLIDAPAARPMAERLLDAADLVWAATDRLGQSLAGPGRRIETMETDLPLDLFPVESVWDSSAKTFDILYIGSGGQPDDLALVLPALERLRQTGVPVRVFLADAGNTPATAPWIAHLPPAEAGGGYPLFLQGLGKAGPFALGIAPLADTEENLRKSAVRWWEYTALGLPTLASDLEPYRMLVDGETGFTVANDVSAWEGKLRRLAWDRENLACVAARARAALRQRYGGPSGVQRRLRSMTGLFLP